MNTNHISTQSRSIRSCLLLICIASTMIPLTGCSERLSGRYVSTRDSDMVLEMNSNGSFYIRGNAGGYSGKYTINGQEITLKGDPGTTLKFTIRDRDTLVEDTGEVFLSSEGVAKRQEVQQQERESKAASARSEQQRLTEMREKARRPAKEIARLRLRDSTRTGIIKIPEVAGEAVLTDVSIRIQQKQGSRNIDEMYYFDDIVTVEPQLNKFGRKPEVSTAWPESRYLYGVDAVEQTKFFWQLKRAWEEWQKKFPELGISPSSSPDSTPFRLPDSLGELSPSR